jgi:GNAT superfamily N-acetyltransferase
MAESDLGLTLRRAGDDDAESIADLVNRAYQVEEFFVDGERTNADEIRELQEDGYFLVLDYASGGLAASVYVRIGDDRGYFGLLSVDPDLQGSGLGKRLVAVSEALAEAAGCSRMDLQVVNLRSELPPWYRSLGYRECGTAPFPHTEKPKLPCHFIRMSKQLGSVAS